MLFFDLDARIVSRNSTLPYSTLKPKANLVRETLAKRFRTDKIAIGVFIDRTGVYCSHPISAGPHHPGRLRLDQSRERWTQER